MRMTIKSLAKKIEEATRWEVRLDGKEGQISNTLGEQILVDWLDIRTKEDSEGLLSEDHVKIYCRSYSSREKKFKVREGYWRIGYVKSLDVVSLHT